MKTNKEIYYETIDYIVKTLGYKLKKNNIDKDFEYNTFEIKGLPNWVFGLYIRSYGDAPENEVHFFTIHKDHIDKFRPSSAVFTYKEDPKYFSEGTNTLFWFIKTMLIQIKYHPIVSYLQDEYGEFEFKAPLLIQYICDKVGNTYYQIVRTIRHKKQDKDFKKFIEERKK